MPARVELRDIRKSFGETEIIKGVDLTIEPSEFVVLVGPSGCGKSTLLRLIAGLEEITSGELRFDDVVVNDDAPAKRRVGMVFQSYALYPHMSVRDNMGFSLKTAGAPKAEIVEKVNAAAETLKLDQYLGERGVKLSGGQRQRVAMGRAIVRDPAIFLFDEPLSNLDAKLRNQMRLEIKRLQRRLGTAAIYVTHDQVEAMTLADRIVVMNDGRIEQVGTPMELFNHPANTFVAGFLGSPPMNQMKAQLTETGARVGKADIKITGAINGNAGRDVIIGIRPEHVSLRPGDGTTPLPIALDLVEPLGSEALLHARFGADEMVFKAETQGDISHLHGVSEVHVPANLVKIFDAETRRALSLEP